MRRQKTDARLFCYASIIVLSLSACTQQGGKLKNGGHLTDNAQPASTSNDKKSRTSYSSRNGSRWLRKKDKSLAGAGGAKNSSQYDNLWDRLFDLYNLPPIEHEDIDRELSWFLNHPDYIDRVQKRAEPFLYSIVKQVEKHDIPGEIALLPVIESAFQPHAVSPANAAGIWQFIPSTGRQYGLKQSRTYDGRRDIYASTRAAIKYLKKLHADFDGDWLLAIAAYNCGEGAVGRAVQKNVARGLPTDFWSLELPQETRAYVPRLLAVAKLFAEADLHGVGLHDIPNMAMFKPVKLNTQVDLALAANAADMPLDKFYELNPGFKSQFADIDGSYRLFIPAEKKSAEFKEELVRLAQESRATGGDRPVTEEIAASPEEASVITHVAASDGVTSADTGAAQAREIEPRAERDLSTVSFQKERREPIKEKLAQAREHEEPTAKLAKALDKTHDRPQPAVLASVEDKNHNRSAKQANYTVQPGETLWSVARKHAVDVEQLAKWNNIPENTNVKAGQTLMVWNKDAAKKLTLANAGIRPSQSIKSLYTVREGDTLFSISKRFKVSVADLRKWNGSNLDKQIHPGKNITVQRDKD